MSTPGKNWADGVWAPGVWADGVWAQADSGPEFIGPPIANLTRIVDLPIAAIDFTPRFAGDGLTFSTVGTLPAGLSLSSAGVLSGTPTETGVFPGLSVRATDGVDTVDSNEFSITIQAAPAARANGQGLVICIRLGV